MSVISVPKTKFKPKMFEYLRGVEKRHDTVLITDHGKPVAEVVPFRQSSLNALERMRGLVAEYIDPLEPVGDKWDADS